MTTPRTAVVLICVAAALFVEAKASTSNPDGARGLSASARSATARPRRSPKGEVGRPPGEQAATPEWLARLTSWLEAVNEHTPGSPDMAARITGLATEEDLGEVRTDFLALVAICRREIHRTLRPESIVYRDTVIPFPDLRKLVGLTDDEAAAGNANRVLKRAAVLHADVAMQVTPLLPGRMGCSSMSTLLLRDGNRIGMGCIDAHWIHGRLLLDAVKPGPDRDEFVRRWYVAAAAYFLERGEYAGAKLHLDRARLLFRSDPDVLLARGRYQEAFASPAIQSVVLDNDASPRSAKSCLEEAEDLFGRATRGNPQLVEARVHRGNTLLLLGRDRDALDELRLAAAAAKGSELAYYAELFLGRAEEGAGSPAAAHAHYLRAAELFPRAQSPRLALALLARRGGDRTGAQDAMGQLIGLPRVREDAADPWAVYYRWHDAGFKARFSALYALLAEGQPQ